MFIRLATQEDISSIAELENSVSSPWSKSQIAAEFAHSAAIILVSTTSKSDSITGWCSLRYIVPEADLLKIAVHPDHRRTRLGEQLLQEALKHTAAAACRVIFLEVRAQNHPARNLYLKLGFEELGIRKNYYKQPDDDAILYRKKVDSSIGSQSFRTTI